MPRSFSLKQKKDFDLLFQKGFRKYSPHFSLVAIKSDEIKIAVIVQKKNILKASSRVYSKRVLRDIIRKNILGKIKNYNIAVIIKCDLKEQSINYNDLTSEVSKLFSSLN